jgi:hypothetical protein
MKTAELLVTEIPSVCSLINNHYDKLKDLILAEERNYTKEKMREVLDRVMEGKFSDNQRLSNILLDSWVIRGTVRQFDKEEKSGDVEGMRITGGKLTHQIDLTSIALDSFDDDQVIDRLLPRVLGSQEIINTAQLWISAAKSGDRENSDKLSAQVNKLVGNER